MWGVWFFLIYLFKLLNNKFGESFWIFRGQISFIRHFRQARRNKIGILRAGRSIFPQVAAFDILNKSDYPSGGAKMTLPLDGAHFRPINTSSKGRVVGLLFRKSQLIKRADRGRVIQSEANIKAEKAPLRAVQDTTLLMARRSKLWNCISFARIKLIPKDIFGMKFQKN